MVKRLAATFLLLWAFPSAVASLQTPGPAARTLDGKPDLSGFWRGPLLRNMDKNVPGGFKAILTPAGAAAYEHNRTKTINPEGLCLFAGIPRASISGVPFQIVQSPTRVAFLYELMWTFRSIPVDGRTLPARPEPSFFGTSVGRWDRDVFVIQKGLPAWDRTLAHELGHLVLGHEGTPVVEAARENAEVASLDLIGYMLNQRTGCMGPGGEEAEQEAEDFAALLLYRLGRLPSDRSSIVQVRLGEAFG